MSQSDNAFPRLNLPYHKIVALALRADIPPTMGERLADDLADLLNEGRIHLHAQYRRGREEHLFATIIDARTAPERHGALIISYETPPPLLRRKPPASSSAERTLWSWLSTCEFEFDLIARVEFMFEATEADKIVSWFPLPMNFDPPVEGLHSPISEIRGIRGVKAADNSDQPDKLLYSFVLDRPNNRDVHFHVEFSVQSSLSARLFTSVVARARSVADSLDLYRRGDYDVNLDTSEST